MSIRQLRVLVWNEWRQEPTTPHLLAVYPDGIHAAIQQGLAEHGLTATTATLDEPDHGLVGPHRPRRGRG